MWHNHPFSQRNKKQKTGGEGGGVEEEEVSDKV